MSFGVGIGDVLATLHTVKRIVEEVQSFRDAPHHFQHLSIELKMLQNTLESVLHIQTIDPSELETLDRIRLIAIHCRQPLLVFINKMRLNDVALGHFRTSATISSIGRRLHWSMISKRDVGELRKVAVSQMVAINVLLGLQQLKLLRNIVQANSAFNEDAMSCLTNSKDLLVKSIKILNNIESVPSEVRSLSKLVANSNQIQESTQTNTLRGVGIITENTETIMSQGRMLIEGTSKMAHQASKTMISIMNFMKSIKRLMILLASLSTQLLTKIAENARMLLDIQANMKRIICTIEAIPLHLTLEIVRFDDALGESWALPFQACQTWWSFKEILRVVVFAVKDNRAIGLNELEFKIEAGAHISQSMIVPRVPSAQDFCQFPSCNKSLATQVDSNDGIYCSDCGRWSVITRQYRNLLPGPAFNSTIESATSQLRRRRCKTCPSLPPLQVPPDETYLFRRVQFIHEEDFIATNDEAKAILEKDPGNATALLFQAWQTFPYRKNIKEMVQVKPLEQVISLAERLLVSDKLNFQAWYLLGRAYFDLGQHEKAYEKYVHASRLNSGVPGFWISVGILYFAANQYHDSLRSIGASIKMNPHLPDFWYNLGVLYESVDQPIDARDAYERYLERITFSDDIVHDRYQYLVKMVTSKTASSKSPLPMRDLDLHSDIKEFYIVDHDDDILIAGIQSREISSSEEGSEDGNEGREEDEYNDEGDEVGDEEDEFSEKQDKGDKEEINSAAENGSSNEDDGNEA